MERRVIEILYADRCSFLPLAIERVRGAVVERQPDLDVEIRLLRIETMAEAVVHGMPGSPTVRVDGRDVEPRADGRPVGLHGRGYFAEGTIERAPTSAWIAAALDALPVGLPRRSRAVRRREGVEA